MVSLSGTAQRKVEIRSALSILPPGERAQRQEDFVFGGAWAEEGDMKKGIGRGKLMRRWFAGVGRVAGADPGGCGRF